MAAKGPADSEMMPVGLGCWRCYQTRGEIPQLIASSCMKLASSCVDAHLNQIPIMSIQVQQVTATVSLEVKVGITGRRRVLRVFTQSNTHTGVLDGFVQPVLVALINDTILAEVLHHQLKENLFRHTSECCPVL